MATLLDRWPEVVGESLAARIKAVAVRGSELLVSVDDPAWASQISWLETQLLDSLVFRVIRISSGVTLRYLANC